MMTLGNTIGRRILAICAVHQITLNKLGSICGITQSTLNNIVSGSSKNPTVATVKKVCDGVGMTLGEFFNTPEFNALEQEVK